MLSPSCSSVKGINIMNAFRFLGYRAAANMMQPRHEEHWNQAQRAAYDAGYDSF